MALKKCNHVVCKKDGKISEEKVRRQYADTRTPARAANTRSVSMFSLGVIAPLAKHYAEWRSDLRKTQACQSLQPHSRAPRASASFLVSSGKVPIYTIQKLLMYASANMAQR